ncbi:MAG: hypothetical protein PHT99_01980 [Methanoregula sp.]|nr:hypothetical protein [Methanoregula sp.]
MMKGFIATCLASPQGQEMIHRYLTSREGQWVIREYLSPLEGKQTARTILPLLLEGIDLPDGVRGSLQEIL